MEWSRWLPWKGLVSASSCIRQTEATSNRAKRIIKGEGKESETQIRTQRHGKIGNSLPGVTLMEIGGLT